MVTTVVRPEFVVDIRGRTKSVLLSVSQYRRLLKHLEDLEDALELDKAVRTGKKFRDYAEIQVELRKAGRL